MAQIVSSSILNPEEIGRVVSANYKLVSEDIKCEFYRRGMHDLYLIMCNNAKYYLKVYRNFKKQGELGDELKLINFLSDNGINVSKPVKGKNGEIICIEYPEGDRFAVLFNECLGTRKMDNSSCEIYGATLAKMHNLFDSFNTDLPDIKSYSLDKYLLGATEQIKAIGHIIPEKQIQFIEKTSQMLKLKVERMLKKEMPYFGIIHGDFNHKNMLLDFNNSISIYDFDLCSKGWRAYDLSVFLWSMCDWGRLASLKRRKYMKYYLKGYNSVRLITKNELDAMVAFIPIRDIWQIGWQIQLREQFGSEMLFNNYINHKIERLNRWIKKYKII